MVKAPIYAGAPRRCEGPNGLFAACPPADGAGRQRYLLLADISGYTAFLASVAHRHGVDLAGGLPAGFEVLGALLDAVIEGVQPAFAFAKLEGDAVFAVAPASGLDGEGEKVLRQLEAAFRAFRKARENAKQAPIMSAPRVRPSRISTSRWSSIGARQYVRPSGRIWSSLGRRSMSPTGS